MFIFVKKMRTHRAPVEILNTNCITLLLITESEFYGLESSLFIHYIYN